MPSSFYPNPAESPWTGFPVQTQDVSYPYLHTTCGSYHVLNQPIYLDYRSPTPHVPFPPPFSPSLSKESTTYSLPEDLPAGLHMLNDDEHRIVSSYNPRETEQDHIEPHRSEFGLKSELVATSFVIEAPAPLNEKRPTTISRPSLRAVHATKEMRQMMGVFRLDPFILQGGCFQQQENLGLSGDPIYIEFYLEVFEHKVYSPHTEELLNHPLPGQPSESDQSAPSVCPTDSLTETRFGR